MVSCCYTNFLLVKLSTFDLAVRPTSAGSVRGEGVDVVKGGYLGRFVNDKIGMYIMYIQYCYNVATTAAHVARNYMVFISCITVI